LRFNPFKARIQGSKKIDQDMIRQGKTRRDKDMYLSPSDVRVARGAVTKMYNDKVTNDQKTERQKDLPIIKGNTR
jgi:hypothetical protein